MPITTIEDEDGNEDKDVVMRADSFRDFVVEQLTGLGAIRCRSMFGGCGVYVEGTFFAIVYQGRLYFKTDVRTRDAYISAGSKPFQPNANQTLSAYYEVPATVLDDASALTEWATLAATIE